MKKKAPLVLSSALLLLATSSYTFSQSYVYRAPAPGIKASLSNGGLPTLPDNGGDENEECPLSEEGVFGIFKASTPDAEEYLNDLIQILGGELYRSDTLLLVIENIENQEPIVINSKDVFQPGVELYSDSHPEIEGLEFYEHQLHICGSDEDNQNDPPITENDEDNQNAPPITVNELEDILNKYDGKKRRDKEDKWLDRRDWEYVEEFPGLDNWFPCGMHSDFYRWWNNNNYDNVYKILC